MCYVDYMNWIQQQNLQIESTMTSGVGFSVFIVLSLLAFIVKYRLSLFL